MDMTVLILAMAAAGVALVALVAVMLLGRRRSGVIAAPTSSSAPAERSIQAPEPSPAASMTMAAADSVVGAMIARGDKIGAVKMVREMTGLGLKEAKDYVEALPNAPPITAIARQVAIAATRASDGSASLRTEAAAFVARGQAIEAIKLVRERTGLGLKEAKDYVDDLAEGLRQAPADPRRAFDDPKLRQAVSDMLAAGQPDQAMRLIQGASGCSIEAARHFIDQIRRG